MDLLEALKSKDNFSFPTSLAASASSAQLPDPELFFTWYCERARDIERGSGSSEAAIELLDLALSRLASSRSLARRFITATRNSLLRYRAHLASLAARLSSGGREVSAEEKARLIEAIRSADWREFEQQRNTKPVIKAAEVSIALEQETGEVEQCSSIEVPNIDWSVELSVLDAVLRGNWSEAISLAAQSTPFPFLPEGEEARQWLLRYCQVLREELQSYDSQASLRTIPASLCNDPWSALVEGEIGCALTTADEDDQAISLLRIKSVMAMNQLKNK